MPFVATWMELEIIIRNEVRNEMQDMQGKKKAKHLSKEALHIAEKRREAKGKGRKER